MIELTNHVAYPLPNTANGRASLLTSALEVVDISIFRNTILFIYLFHLFLLPVDSFQTRRRAYSNKDCVYAADSCQSNVRGIGVILQKGITVVKGTEEEEERTLSLFLIYCSSLSPCLLIMLSLTFYSPHTHVNNFCYHADPRLQMVPSWKSDVLLLIVCHWPYHSSVNNPCFFFFQCWGKRKNCCSNILSTHVCILYVSLFAYDYPLKQPELSVRDKSCVFQWWRHTADRDTLLFLRQKMSNQHHPHCSAPFSNMPVFY